MIILLGIVSFVGVFLFLVLSSNQARPSRLGRKQARRVFPDDKNLQKVYICLVRDGKRYARLLSLYTAAQKYLQDGSVVSFRASSLDQFRKQSPEKVFKRAVSEDLHITSFWSRWFGFVESGFYDALNSLDPNEEEADFRSACGFFDMGELKFREYNRVRMAMDAEIGNRFSRLDISQSVAWRYDSPGGRKHYHDSGRIDRVQLQSLFAVQEADDTFSQPEFNRFGIPTKQCEAERKKLTAKLRYEILKRDGFRCQICGASQEDGVKLHVDHIKPVARGGLTAPENLRTLCQSCNLGKSSGYDEGGLN